MALDVTERAYLGRPPAEVAAYLADPRNDTEWIGGIVEVDAPEGPLAVGTRVPRVAKFMGRRVEYVLEVERLEPGLLEMRSVLAPFPMLVRYEVTPSGGGSSVALRLAGGPGGIARLFAPVMAWQVRRNLRADLVRLRRVLET